MRNTPLRSAGVAVLLALTFVLALLTPVAIWSRGQVLDTDRYLSTIAPLAADTAIQEDVSDRVTDAILKQFRDRGLSASQVFGGSVGDRVDATARRTILTTTLQVVRSPAFRSLWITANRQAHAELVRTLTGKASAGVQVQHGRITIDLSGVVDAVRQRLVSLGLVLLAQLPPVHLVVDVADASGLQSARDLVKLLDTLAWVLPVATILLLALTILIGTDRRRTAMRACGGILVAMLVLRLAIGIGSIVATAKVPESSAGDTAVQHYYAHLTSLLDKGVLTIGVIAALGVLAVALLTPAPRPWAAVALSAAGVLALATWSWPALLIVVVVAIAGRFLRACARARRATLTS